MCAPMYTNETMYRKMIVQYWRAGMFKQAKSLFLDGIDYHYIKANSLDRGSNWQCEAYFQKYVAAALFETFRGTQLFDDHVKLYKRSMCDLKKRMSPKAGMKRVAKAIDEITKLPKFGERVKKAPTVRLVRA